MDSDHDAVAMRKRKRESKACVEKVDLLRAELKAQEENLKKVRSRLDKAKSSFLTVTSEGKPIKVRSESVN
jgi:hypothetical protein